MPSAAHRQTQADRVVLLIDLDCFYAQCECIRLGFDSTVTPLALLQWNSVLAVTYPARELYGIKRGDGWDEVRRKSDGKCLAVHVPMLSHVPAAASSNNGDHTGNQELANDENPFTCDALDEEYDKIFQANETDQQAARSELGVRRFSHEGKACIERYRIASRRIFSTILDYFDDLNKNLKQKLIMERASIDELFFDVSGACFTDLIVKETDEDFVTAIKSTKIMGKEEINQSTEEGDNEIDLLETLAFQRGMVLASRIRRIVRDTLNFTMTAGIGQNKTVAKLSATYGKPNGQAVTLPSAVDYLLRHTEINKCRNFGGKLGKRIQSMLPEGAPTTMGSIASNLSISDLERGLGDAGLARWVYQAVRGIDTEAVADKEQSLIKSITAFKSLPFHGDGHTIEQAEPWIRLLAQEVVKRVEQDSERNSRYPRSLNIHYAAQAWGHQKTISTRIDFPPERLTTDEKIKLLSENVPRLIANKAGKDFLFHRIGLCAENFMSRERAGKAITSYFAIKADTSASGTKMLVNEPHAAATSSVLKPGSTSPLNGEDLSLASAVPEDNIKQKKQQEAPNRDLDVAKALQMEYDREQRMLETLERRDKLRGANNGQSSKKKRACCSATSSTKRIDSFFQKR
ncbi:hypothetical protein MPSEU_000099300 [Mayamaea pseudoterrestris]|nr:hypothetical protein MPSEU_000099300 [Mayamaea pseudoterrestris]